MKAQVMQGAAVLSAAAAVSLFQASPAAAYTINGSSITIDNTSVGQFFEVEFDGNVRRTPVPGLTSNAKFEIVSFSGTSAVFNINLTNTSSGGITSRTSILGFDVDRTLTGASASGGFDRAVLGRALPNQFGPIDVCFKGGGGPNNCAGGGGDGATAGNPIDFLATLNFGGPSVSDFTLS
ncbi:MAG: cistern family PEP-CTERM protein, partial [Cyanobacteria bacterium J06638_6]